MPPETHTEPDAERSVDPPDADRQRRVRRRVARARELIDDAPTPTLVLWHLGVALAATALAGVALTGLADEIMEAQQPFTPDERIVGWVVQHRTPALTTFFRTATDLGDYWTATAVVATVAGVLLTRRRWGAAVTLFASSSGCALVTTLLKNLIDRDRPPIDSRLVDATGYAFPSGHSSQSVACWGGLALVIVLVTRRRGLRIAAIGVAAVIGVAVGCSRTYLGVHWPSDVLSGWITGLTWLTIVASTSLLLRRLDRPRSWWPVDDPATASGSVEEAARSR